MKKEPSADLKRQYRRWLEFGLVVSLLLHIFLMQGYKKVKTRVLKRNVQIEALQVEEIPQTQQQRQAPAPSRPTVPIASEDESLPEDETIEFTDLDLESEPPPPPPPPSGEEDIFAFVPHDEAPTPIGGFAAIQKALKYPDFARKAGVEGYVRVMVQIDVDGSVAKHQIVQQLVGCDEAAVKAIRSVKWKPAMQRDRPVKVWVMVPVEFRLK
jgi:protein TonB